MTNGDTTLPQLLPPTQPLRNKMRQVPARPSGGAPRRITAGHTGDSVRLSATLGDTTQQQLLDKFLDAHERDLYIMRVQSSLADNDASTRNVSRPVRDRPRDARTSYQPD